MSELTKTKENPTAQRRRVIDSTNAFRVTRQIIDSEDRYWVIISSTPEDKKPVEVQINGMHFMIPRDKKQPLPVSVIDVLKHAEQKIIRTTANGEESFPVKAYPFNILEKVTPEEMEDFKKKQAEAEKASK